MTPLSESAVVQPRVAFLNVDLWLGGGTVFLINFAADLVRRGIPCQVFGLNEVNSLAADFERLHIPVSCGQPGEIFEDRVAGALRKLAIFQPTVVIGSCPDVWELYRYIPDGVGRLSVIHLALSSTTRCVPPYKDFMDAAIAVAPHVKEAIEESLGDDSLPVYCIEPGVPIPETLPPRSLNNGDDAPLRILYLGRLEEDAKRVRTFPVIFKHLQESGIPFVWNIAGGGPERPYLESQLVSDNPKQVVNFRGIVSYSDVPALLAENDIILLTSDSESFPLSLQEAMGSGLVPVVSDIKGRVREAVTEDIGIRVPVENLKGYADAIVWLHHHREAMKGMSAAAYQAIHEGYSVEVMVDRWMPFLEKRPATPPVWPKRWKIKAPIMATSSLNYSMPMRILRRIGKRLRASRLPFA
jgi:glycosyltransferase involved in cell wall biosynthesis